MTSGSSSVSGGSGGRELPPDKNYKEEQESKTPGQAEKVESALGKSKGKSKLQRSKKRPTGGKTPVKDLREEAIERTAQERKSQEGTPRGRPARERKSPRGFGKGLPARQQAMTFVSPAASSKQSQKTDKQSPQKTKRSPEIGKFSLMSLDAAAEPSSRTSELTSSPEYQVAENSFLIGGGLMHFLSTVHEDILPELDKEDLATKLSNGKIAYLQTADFTNPKLCGSLNEEFSLKLRCHAPSYNGGVGRFLYRYSTEVDRDKKVDEKMANFLKEKGFEIEEGQSLEEAGITNNMLKEKFHDSLSNLPQGLMKETHTVRKINVEAPLTSHDAEVLRSRGFAAAEEGKTLKDVGIYPENVIQAFEGIDKVPSALKTQETHPTGKPQFVALDKRLNDDEAAYLREKGFSNVEGGKSLRQCTDKKDLPGLANAVIDKFGGIDYIPATLATTWNPEFDQLGRSKALSYPIEGDITLIDLGISQSDLENAFGFKIPDSVSLKSKLSTKVEGKTLKEFILEKKLVDQEAIDTKLVEKQRKAETNNKEVRQLAMDCYNWFRSNNFAQFDQGRNRTAKKMATVQLMCEVGIGFHDVVRGNAEFEQALIDAGATTRENIDDAKAFDRAIRQNPLLAEIPNFMITAAMSEALYPSNGSDSEIKRRISEHIRERLVAVNAERDEPFTDEQIETLVDQILKRYAEKIKKYKTNLFESNPRGRFRYRNDPARARLAGMLRSTGKNDSVMTLQVGALDENGEEIVMDISDTVCDHFEDPETREGLYSAEGPITILRGGTGYDTKLVRLWRNPHKLLETVFEDGYPTLEGNGIQERDVINAYGGIDKVPNELKSKPDIKRDLKLTQSLVDALTERGVTAYDGAPLIAGKTLLEQGVTRRDLLEKFDGKIAEIPSKLVLKESVILNKPLSRNLIQQLSEEPRVKLDVIMTPQLVSLFRDKGIEIKKGETPASRKITAHKIIEKFGGFENIPDALKLPEERGFKITPTEEENQSLDLGESLVNQEFSEALRETVAAIEIPFNKATAQQISVSEALALPSVNSLMNHYNLASRCSISGTTADETVGELIVQGREAVRERNAIMYNFSVALPDLEARAMDMPKRRNFASEEEFDAAVASYQKRVTKDTEAYRAFSWERFSGSEGDEFLKHTLTIVAFMHTGRYHELIESFLMKLGIDPALSNDDDNNQNIAKAYGLAEKLLKFVSTDPLGIFVGLTEKEKESLRNAVGAFKDDYLDEIRTRRGFE